MKRKNKVYWVDRAFFPTRIGFCATEKAWDEEMKRLGVEAKYPPYDGCCTAFESDLGEKCVVVTIKDTMDGKQDVVQGLMAHEISHVVDYIMEFMREEKPSSEFRAYTTQYLYLNLMHAYKKSLKVK